MHPLLRVLALALLGAQIFMGRTAAAEEKDKYWTASLGGEWDFLTDEGPPLNGTDWQEIRYGFGYVDRKRFSLLFSHRIPGRTDDFDQVLGLEGYLKIHGPVWLRAFAALSPDHDFAYRDRVDGELEWNFPYVTVGAGYWFIDYNTTNIHAATPFVRAYWKDLSGEFRYLRMFDTQADDWFNSFSVRVENRFDARWIQPYVGAVVGSRLFGILTLQQSPGQEGFLVYAGDRLGLTSHLDLMVTVSYAEEEDFFRYVGLATDLVVKF